MINSFQDVQIAINRIKKTLSCKQQCIQRLSTVDKLAIVSPIEGLQVYDLTLHQLSYYDGTVWVNLT